MLAFQVFAHPHMFVDVKSHLMSAKDNEIKISVQWFFDELTSEGLIMDYDQNENFSLEKKEMLLILNDFKDELKKQHYFTTIIFNNKKIKFKLENIQVKSKKIKSRKNKQNIAIIYYEFGIILNEKIEPINQLNISFYDPTIYSVLSPKEKMTTNNLIKISSNKMETTKCRFKVEFSK